MLILAKNSKQRNICKNQLTHTFQMVDFDKSKNILEKNIRSNFKFMVESSHMHSTCACGVDTAYYIKNMNAFGNTLLTFCNVMSNQYH